MNSIFRPTLLACVFASLTACGGSDDPVASPPASQTLNGLAATGAAIPNADVSARCVTGDELRGKTGTDGVFNLTLSATHTAPCMLAVVNGTSKLYSFATEAGRVNITPATDLVVANALKGNPADVFAGFGKETATTISTGLVAAKTYVKAQLKLVTGVDYAADPLSDALVVDDANDKVLDALGEVLKDAGITFADLRDGARNGADLSQLLSKEPPASASFFGPNKTAADIAFLNGQSFTGTNCSVSFANGTMTVTDAANNRTASASFSGDAFDRIVPADSAQINFKFGDDLKVVNGNSYPATGKPSALAEFSISNYVNSQAILQDAFVNQYDAAGKVTGASCFNIRKEITAWVRPTLSTGTLNMLETYSADISRHIELATDVPKLAGTYTGLATGGIYQKVQTTSPFSTLTNLKSQTCSLTVDAQGLATLTVADKTRAESLVGEWLLFHGSSMLKIPSAASALDTEYVKGYQFGQPNADVYITWADAAQYEGPVSVEFKATASDSSREQFSCQFK